MSVWDVIPFVVGAYYLFGRSRKKTEIEQPAQPAPKKRPEISLEDVWKQLTEQVTEVPMHHQETVVETVKPKVKSVLVKDQSVQDYSEYQGRTTMRPDSVGHTLKRANTEKKSYVKSKNIEQYDDKVVHSKSNALHRDIDRHFAEEVENLTAEDIDLRQLIVYDAILNRPKL